MFKILKESLRITNNNIIIATPLILFSLLSSLYLIFSGHGSSIGMLLTVLLFFLMLAAFLAGWFYVVTVTVKDPYGKGSFGSEFMSGVGEYFLPIIGFLFNTFVITMVMIVCAFLLGKKFIGSPGVSSSQIIEAMTTVEAMKTFASSLSAEQLVKINQWNLLVFFTMIFNYFIFMFYAPAMYFKKKNPFIALCLSIRDLFSAKFFGNLGLFFMIFVSYMLLSAFNALLGSNLFVHFLLTIINFYYATLIVVFVFNYYYSNYAKIGSNIDKMV